MNRHQGIVFLLTLLLGPILPDASAVLPMREQWHQACRALEQGNPASAVTLFREFEDWYGAEADANEERFRNRRIRLHGLACLQAGFTTEGIELLEKWLEQTGVSAPFHAYIRFQMGMANLSIDKKEQAIHHWKQFLENHGHLPECILVHWMWSDLELSSGNKEEALRHMQTILESTDLQPATRALARAAVALVNLSNDSADTAASIFEDPEGLEECGIFMLWRSLLAAPVVKSLLSENMPERAASASQWFEPPDSNQAQLRVLVESLQQRGPSVYRKEDPRESLWNQHWQRQIEKLGCILEQLEDIQNLEMLYRLKLETLLKSGNNVAAASLAQAILKNRNWSGNRLWAHAYKAAIRANQQLSRWEQARSLANEFLEQFPSDEDLPDILLLNARTAAGTRDHQAALEQVGDLLSTYPAHPARASWAMLKGEWLLSSGRGNLAMGCFTDLQEWSHDTWWPFLQFQKGRCMESLGNFKRAVSLFASVTNSSVATPALTEFAATCILKIHLRQMNGAGFFPALETYRNRHPDGANKFMVENLAGSFYMASGQWTEAEACFENVSLQSGSAATYAHDQLSVLYRNSSDNNALIEHAIGWIRQYRRVPDKLPPTPFQDCLYYWRKTGSQAIPGSLLISLLEDLDAGNGRLPGQSLLSIVVSGWDHYKSCIHAREDDPLEWIESKAMDLFRKGNTAAFSTYMFHLGDCLEKAGRIDSAEAKRIQVLKAATPGDLEEYILLGISRTAHRYDFPESIALLRCFLERFPESSSRPEALHLLAKRYQSRNEPGKFLPLYREILSDWPGSRACIPSGIALSRHLIDISSFEEARSIVLDLLENTNIGPRDSASLLLILAESGFSMDLPEKAGLACMRIIKLYPYFHDTCESARSLLLKHQDQISSPDQKAFIDTLEKLDETVS